MSTTWTPLPQPSHKLYPGGTWTPLPPRELPVMDVYCADMGEPLVDYVTFHPEATAGQVYCYECRGSGWWAYGPEESCDGICIDCKGTGLSWVSLP